MRIETIRRNTVVTLVAGALALPVVAAAQPRSLATPGELVSAYDALADTILGANKAERKLVLAILATSYGHAQAELAGPGRP